MLPAFREDLRRYARRALERLGVEVRTGAAVTACDAGGVCLGAERIEAATVIWAAGVRASPAGHWLGLETDRSGRVNVGADLAVPDQPNVFVIGDAAHVVGKDGEVVPGIAPAAKQQGRYVAKVITDRVQGKSPPVPLRYRHAGHLATALVLMPDFSATFSRGVHRIARTLAGVILATLLLQALPADQLQ